jgi:hypothetical protein
MKVREDLRAAAEVAGTSPLLIPVYIDLLKLGAESDPSDFFRLVMTSAMSACENIQGLPNLSGLKQLPPTGLFTLDHVTDRLGEILGALQRSDARFIFLLDESKRILGPRFPRGVQDNLFSLMFGEHCVSGRISLVFAGAQELYAFSIDDTSPIGSRAATITLCNLEEAAIEILANSVPSEASCDREKLATRVFDLAGGQPGLTMRLLLDHRQTPLLESEESMTAFRMRHSGLLQIWAAAFTPEARCVESELIQTGRLRYDQIASALAGGGFDRYRTGRVCDEFVFSGIAVRSSDGLTVVNQIYSSFALAYLGEGRGSAEEQDAWAQIERAELALRISVRAAYSAKWGRQADARIASVLGPKSMETIHGSRSKSSKSYRYTAHDVDDDILHFAYFGQLTQLMLANVAWDMFSGRFRDKRELEDIVKDVTPVRNDSAHFRSVPDRERVRCAIRCDDLVHLLGT